MLGERTIRHYLQDHLCQSGLNRGCTRRRSTWINKQGPFIVLSISSIELDHGYRRPQLIRWILPIERYLDTVRSSFIIVDPTYIKSRTVESLVALMPYNLSLWLNLQAD